ncbi:MAG: hypothetical protein SGI98_10225 [Verrucomicrobiota bacterium]|nr:hypothetical protein [Verrucomicrobiota bacterium]
MRLGRPSYFEESGQADTDLLRHVLSGAFGRHHPEDQRAVVEL